MTIKQNTLKPVSLNSHETDFGTSIAESLWMKVVDSQNWLNFTVPIGYCMYFNGAQTYANGTLIDKPNPEIWILCDGQIISDVNSPLDGVTTPDLRNRFLKGFPTIGTTGGASTINLRHNHGGTVVEENDESGSSNADQGGDHVAGSRHDHVIETEWPSNEPIIPPYREAQIYMRYK